MSIPQSILDLENRSIGRGAEPTLGEALELAADEWRSGNRDRELRLHLLFLCWFCNVEPPHLTGHREQRLPSEHLPQLFQDVYGTFAGEIQDDAECLFIVGLMAQIAPWTLGEDVSTWEARSAAFRERYRALLPDGIPSNLFAGRGAYGDYFAGQAMVRGGY